MTESFKSVVVLDLETTGLPGLHGKCRITEVALVGAVWEQIKETHHKSQTLPRVLQKLNLCIYPNKMIHYTSTEVTGLDNALLEDLPPWNVPVCDMLKSFFQRLPPPICLVAHNGMKFDFPLLKAELTALNQVFPTDIRCADSLIGFRALFPYTENSYFVYFTPSTSNMKPTTPVRSCSTQNCPVTNENKPESVDFFNQTDAAREALRLKNETTPKQEKKTVNSNPPALKKKSLEPSEDSPRVKKQLFGTTSNKPKSHKLIDLYSFILNKDLSNGHYAENDAVGLLECIVKTAPEFLDWVADNSIAFDKIPPMW